MFSFTPPPPPVLSYSPLCKRKEGSEHNKKRKAGSALDATVAQIQELIEKEHDTQRTKEAKGNKGESLRYDA